MPAVALTTSLFSVIYFSSMRDASVYSTGDEEAELMMMTELASWIDEHQLKQSEAAEILMISRPRVSDVVNKKTAKFTIDTLVEMLSRVGKTVKLAVC